MDQASKLKKFESAVFAEIDIKTDQIKQEAESFKKSELEKNKDVQLMKAYNEIQKKSQEIKKKFKREVAKFGLDAKRNVLLKRNELTAKVFDSVTLKLTEFYHSDDYQGYLAKKLMHFSKQYALSGVDILVGEKDFQNADQLKSAYALPCSLVEDKTIKIGGFIVRDTKDNVYFDETLATRLSDQKTYFIENSELFL